MSFNYYGYNSVNLGAFGLHLSWDPKKDEEHKAKRGVGFAYVSQILD